MIRDVPAKGHRGAEVLVVECEACVASGAGRDRVQVGWPRFHEEAPRRNMVRSIRLCHTTIDAQLIVSNGHRL